MARDNPITRRTAMKVTGAAAATALIAGCGDDDDDDEEEETFEIEAGEQIEFDGQTSGWEGVAPGDIDGEVNPTLVLEEGETYEIGWEEGDGQTHNIQLENEDRELVDDDWQTDRTQEPDGDQWIEFEATDDIAYYVCDPHPDAMRGEIQIE